MECNNLLFIFWICLFIFCGLDWVYDNSFINGCVLFSLEVVLIMFFGFSKNLMVVVKMIEIMIGNF